MDRPGSARSQRTPDGTGAASRGWLNELEGFFTRVALVGPAEILETLGPPSELQRAFREFDAPNAREFYLFRALLEVQKAGTAMLRWHEFVDKHGKDRNSLAEISLTALIAEQCVWQRRLAEVLLRLVGFSTTNDPVFYEHLLRATALEKLLHAQNEQRVFFGSESASSAARINAEAARLEQMYEATSSLGTTWYTDRNYLRNLRARKGPLLASARSLTRMALPHASPFEKRSLGHSYRQAFGAPSETIHFNPLPEDRDLDASRFQFCWIQLSFLAMCVVERSQSLLGRVVDGEGCNIARQAANREDKSHPFREVAQVGDYVIVMPDGPTRVFVAEVLQIHPSAFGNESLRIRYLQERPYPDVDEDDIMPDLVQEYLAREGFGEVVRQNLRAGLNPDDPHREQIVERLMQDSDAAIRKAVLFTWEKGMRAHFERQLAEARERS